MNHLISIIVPIYNTEKYLKKCIESILHQTYKNIELILVDDNSTDSSLDICNKYLKDKRVNVFHIKKSGVSNTRNYGLKQAKGDFITFVDSDDYIDKDYIKILYDNILYSNSDVSICNYNNIYKNKVEKFCKKNIKFENEGNCLNLLLEHKYFKGQVWGKLYKKSIIENIKFSSDLDYYEDLLFNFEVFKKVNKVIYDSTPLYNYLYKENSYNYNKLMFIDVCGEFEKYYIEKNYNLSVVYSLIDYFYICNINSMSINFNKNNIDKYKLLVKHIRNNILRIIFKDKMNFKYKIAASIIFINKNLYIKLSKYINKDKV